MQEVLIFGKTPALNDTNNEDKEVGTHKAKVPTKVRKNVEIPQHAAAMNPRLVRATTMSALKMHHRVHHHHAIHVVKARKGTGRLICMYMDICKYVYVYLCICVYLCACLYMSARRAKVQIDSYVHKYICMDLYAYVCICVYVCTCIYMSSRRAKVRIQ